MDKRLLKLTLTSGSSKVFNSLAVTKEKSEAGQVKDEDLLFSVRALNYGVYFKEPTDKTWNRDVEAPVDTLLYFPYNSDRILDGGVSVSLNDPRFTDVMKEFSQAFGTADHKNPANDRNILNVFKSTPSLDPYLLRSAFQRYGVEVPSDYLKISDEEWAAIREHVRTKLNPMIVFGMKDKSPKALARVDELVERIWDGSDVSSLFPLLEALQIGVTDAPDIVFAWKGLTFFEYQYERQVPAIRNCGSWLRDRTAPSNFVRPEERGQIEQRCGEVRRLLHKHLSTIIKILKTYREGYETLFIRKEGAGDFQTFLHDCRNHYVSLGASLNRVDHCAETLDRQLKGDFGRARRSDELLEITDCLVEILR